MQVFYRTHLQDTTLSGGRGTTVLVVSWTGAADVREQVPTYWRWSGEGLHQHFVMREGTECWMVEFSEAPADSVEVEARDPFSPGPDLEHESEPHDLSMDGAPEEHSPIAL